MQRSLKGDLTKTREAKLRLFARSGRRLLCIVSVVSLMPKYDYLNEKALMVAVQTLLPTAWVFVKYHQIEEDLPVFYVEVKKKQGEPFTLQEIAFLRENLRAEILKRIERLLPSTFGSCLEEENMKNTVILVQEAEKCGTCPHVMISFDHVEREHLLFTLLIAQSQKKNRSRLENLLKRNDPYCQWILKEMQRFQRVEAAIFQVKLSIRGRFLLGMYF